MNFFYKIAQWIDEACEKGLKFPFAHDPVNKKPSVTLLTYYIALYITVASVLWLHYKPQSVIPTSFAMLFWVLSYVFYRIRKLDNAKISLEDKSIELNSKDED
jgi:hypothetical protein